MLAEAFTHYRKRAFFARVAGGRVTYNLNELAFLTLECSPCAAQKKGPNRRCAALFVFMVPINELVLCPFSCGELSKVIALVGAALSSRPFKRRISITHVQWSCGSLRTARGHGQCKEHNQPEEAI